MKMMGMMEVKEECMSMAKVITSIDFLEKRYLRAWTLADMIRIADLMKVE